MTSLKVHSITHLIIPFTNSYKFPQDDIICWLFPTYQTTMLHNKRSIRWFYDLYAIHSMIFVPVYHLITWDCVGLCEIRVNISLVSISDEYTNLFITNIVHKANFHTIFNHKNKCHKKYIYLNQNDNSSHLHWSFFKVYSNHN